MSKEGYNYEPCPFCGKQKYLSMDTMSNHPYKWIRCLSDHFGIGVYTGPVSVNAELAIQMWNYDSKLRFNGIPKTDLAKEEFTEEDTPHALTGEYA